MDKIDLYLLQLENTRELSSLPPDYIFELEKELNQLILKIKSCSSFEEADHLLLQLEPFQEKLALMSFKYSLPMSEMLNTVIRLFDRADDLETRKYFLNFVKNNWVFPIKHSGKLEVE